MFVRLTWPVTSGQVAAAQVQGRTVLKTTGPIHSTTSVHTPARQHVCLRACLQCDQWTAAKPRTAIATGTRQSLNCRPCYHCCSNPVIGEISRRDSLHKGVYQHHPWLQLSHGVCLKVQKLQQHMGVFHAKARANAFKETIQVVALDYRCVCNYQF
jgi:hypothetical protein